MDRIVSLSAKHVGLALREPFETAKRRAVSSDTVVIMLETEIGVTGHGAATPVRYVTGETVESVVSAVNEAGPAIIGDSARQFSSVFLKLAELLPDSPSARAGIEIALIDAAGKLSNVPSYELFEGLPLTIETDITIPVVPAKRAGELAATMAARGFRYFKVKVGSKDPDEDLARVKAISTAAPGSRLVLDANQGFSPREAIEFIESVTRAGVSLAIFEQPVDAMDIEGLAKVTRELEVPVFADESAQTPTDVVRLAAARAVDGVNVKLMKSGFFGALEIAAECGRQGLELMMGCMLEPRVSLTAALHVACSAQKFIHFDLDADLLLAAENDGGFTRTGAWIYPSGGPGLNCPT